MLLSYKYSLKPSTKQAAALEDQLSLCRSTYNTLLDHCYEERKVDRGTPTQFSLQNQLPTIKSMRRNK
jgi:transposase